MNVKVYCIKSFNYFIKFAKDSYKKKTIFKTYLGKLHFDGRHACMEMCRGER